MSDVLFISVSGPRSSGRSTLYQNLMSAAPESFRDEQIAFIGNPLGHLPHPTAWSHAERSLDPSTRLLQLWAPLNEFCLTQLVPALTENSIVITEGFGLDAVLYAVASADEENRNRAESLHHELVTLRLRKNGLRPPHYLITQATGETIAERLAASEPKLPGFDFEAMRRHAVREQMVITDYFMPAHQQRKPTYLVTDGADPANLTLQAIDEIDRLLRNRNIMAA